MDRSTTPTISTGLRLLDRIASDEFIVQLAGLFTRRAVRATLRGLPEFRPLCQGIGDGTITEHQVRTYVACLLRHYAPGVRFPYSESLAMLAAVYEAQSTSFADEYLIDLARLDNAEFRLPIQVARECLHHRHKRPRSIDRVSLYRERLRDPLRTWIEVPAACSLRMPKVTPIQRYSECRSSNTLWSALPAP